MISISSLTSSACSNTEQKIGSAAAAVFGDSVVIRSAMDLFSADWCCWRGSCRGRGGTGFKLIGLLHLRGFFEFVRTSKWEEWTPRDGGRNRGRVWVCPQRQIQREFSKTSSLTLLTPSNKITTYLSATFWEARDVKVFLLKQKF